MRIIETSPEEYGSFFTQYPHVYNTVGFNLLNRHKADRLRFLVFADRKPRLGLILGDRGDGRMYTPFSAPFGGFTTDKPQHFETTDNAVSLLKAYAGQQDRSVVITLPPPFYDERQLPVMINALHRQARTRFIDVNYHFDISDFAAYTTLIERNARKNLSRAMKENLCFEHVKSSDTEGVKRAYAVIKANREEHGYPLRMSLEEVIETTRIIPADFFLLTHEGQDIAAAQVFHVKDDVCQVIYWGDRREFSSLRPMNCLAYRIFQFYHEQGIKTLDIGPSTEEGLPNHGLCDFKDGIGCKASTKFSFEL